MSDKKLVEVTVRETIYRYTIVTVEAGRGDDVETLARDRANNQPDFEWEVVNSDGYEFEYEDPFPDDEDEEDYDGEGEADEPQIREAGPQEAGRQEEAG